MSVFEIPYRSEQHRKVLAAVQDRFSRSDEKISERRDDWEETDKLFRGFVKSTDDVEERRQARKDGESTYIDVTIPYSYALLLTAHTYWSSVFLGRTPIFQYTARHGEGQQQVQAVEAIIDYQVQQGNMLVPLYIWLLDAGKYGFGVLGNYWSEEYSTVSEMIEVPDTFMGIKVGDRTKQKKRVTQIPGYHGNRVFNIKPYDFYPDPNVSLTNLQDGEFCGYKTQTHWNELHDGGQRGEYFNLEELEKMLQTSDEERVDPNNYIDYPDRPGDNWSGPNRSHQELGKGFVELGVMFINLIPRDWELGKGSENGDYSEKWVFVVANGKIIIKAQPLGLIHNKFPFLLTQYEVEGYEHISRGMPQVLKDLNDTMSWLFNTHFFNVRKSLNDMFVVDPQKVSLKDLTDGGPGKIIRLLPPAWGTDVRAALQQLPVADVTRANIEDSKHVSDLMQLIVGVTDNVMGAVHPGGRKTATEVRTSSSFSINRMKTFAEYNSALGFSPLSQVLLQNTQQKYDIERKFRIVGDLMQSGPTKWADVNPEAIAGFFDFVPVDGTMPVDRFAQANLWKEVLLGMSQMPAIMMQYDVGGIFSWMAQLAGLKNINQFRINVQPDAAVQNMVAGGAQPLAEAGAVQ